MTHTFTNLATVLSNAIAAAFSSSPDRIDKIAEQLKCEYPYETVEYIATLIREGRWHA